MWAVPHNHGLFCTSDITGWSMLYECYRVISAVYILQGGQYCIHVRKCWLVMSSYYSAQFCIYTENLSGGGSAFTSTWGSVLGVELFHCLFYSVQCCVHNTEWWAMFTCYRVVVSVFIHIHFIGLYVLYVNK